MGAPKGNQYAKGCTTSGGPTKYKPAYPDDVKEHLAQGYTLASWAGTVGVCRETCYNWANKHKEFINAIKIGRAKGQLVWEKRLETQALTNAGNTASIIFAMKNLYKDDWADKIINEVSGPDGKPIQTEEVSGSSKLTAYLEAIAERSGKTGKPES